jgi:multidrug efflux pump subunit AcrB
MNLEWSNTYSFAFTTEVNKKPQSNTIEVVKKIERKITKVQSVSSSSGLGKNFDDLG